MSMMLCQFMPFSSLWFLANLTNVKKKVFNLGLPHRIAASTTILILQDEYSFKSECCKKNPSNIPVFESSWSKCYARTLLCCSDFSALDGKLATGSLLLVNYAEENTVKEKEYNFPFFTEKVSEKNGKKRCFDIAKILESVYLNLCPTSSILCKNQLLILEKS